MKVIILTTDADSKYAKVSYRFWVDNGFINIEYYEVRRDDGTTRPSKIVMNNWKKYFAINDINEDIIIAEDDVIVKKKYNEIKNEIAQYLDRQYLSANTQPNLRFDIYLFYLQPDSLLKPYR